MTQVHDVEDRDESVSTNEYSYWAPRIWHGMSMRNWGKLLVQNRFALNRVPFAAWVTWFSLFNSPLNRIQKFKHWKRASAMPLAGPPIFLIGHWRTGTTLLHNLFSLDDRFRAPSTFECLTPGHFMISKEIIPKMFKFPERRPMDNVAMGWEEPQEDELALCVRGAPSVYRNMAFPFRKIVDMDSLSMDEMSDKRLAKWKRTLLEFVSYLNCEHQLPLVMKSPTHTARVRLLSEMFPGAKFVHITRDPQSFIPSTLHLWRAMHEAHALQFHASRVDREDFVFDCFRRMYVNFEAQKHCIDAGNICHVSFESLTTNTEETMANIYQSLQLPGYGHVAAKIEAAVAEQRDYKKNKHEVSERLSDRITDECADYVEQYVTLTAAA